METENGMEIERKWLVSDWPEKAGVNLNLVKEEKMRQGYVSVEPTVRIREEISMRNTKEASYLLTFKSSGLLSRKEIEFPIEKRYFAELEELISHPLVPKVRRTYALPDGLFLEVNHVDGEAETAFWYAEVEFRSEEEARSWKANSERLARYLSNEVTEKAGFSMGAYWKKTRISGL